jgi:hypothetical protein
MPIVKLPGGQLRDEIREPLYDTIDITDASVIQGTRRFFSDVQGKSRTESNLRQNNLLETAVSFRAMGMAIDAQNFNLLNYSVMPLFLEHSSLKFQAGEKAYFEGPMRFVAGRLYTDLGGDVSNTFMQHGFPAVAGLIWTGKHVVDINPLQTFFVEWLTDGMTSAEVVLATPQASTKVRYVCSLKGLKRRPVQ